MTTRYRSASTAWSEPSFTGVSDSLLEGRNLPAPAYTDMFLTATYGPSWRVPDPSFRHEPGTEIVERFDAWFGNKSAPVNGFLEPSPIEKFEGRPEFQPDSLHKTAMIGTPDEVVDSRGLAVVSDEGALSEAVGWPEGCGRSPARRCTSS